MKKENAKRTKPSKDLAVLLEETTNKVKPDYLLKGMQLQPVPTEYQPAKLAARRFISVKELTQLVLRNIKVLFGQQAFIVPLPKKKGASREHVPDFFMLDIGDRTKPRVYILDIVLSKQDFLGYVVPRITKFYLNEKENMEAFYKLIGSNKDFNNLLQDKATKGASELVERIGKCKPFILLVTDGELKGLPEMTQAYPQWQNVKQVVIKKYASGKDTVCSVTPPFFELHNKEGKKRQTVPLTEEQHLEKAPEDLRLVYKRIKAELLAVNNQLQFNSQKYYISVRKNRNLAFFHFSRKNITLVVMNPEKDARKKIKHFEIKTLTEKVQKFWNGSCCTIVIDKNMHLKEVIDLLKKLINA